MNLKRILPLLLLSVLLPFCKKKDLETPTSLDGSNMKADLNNASGGTPWEGLASAKQTSWDNTIIQTSNSTDGSILQIVLRDSIHLGSFPIREDFYCNAFFTKNSITYVTSQMTMGDFTIVQVDKSNQTISGHYGIQFFVPGNSGYQGYSLQGTFTNVPYTKSITSSPSLYFKAKVEGANYLATKSTMEIPESGSTTLEALDGSGSKISINMSVTDMGYLNQSHSSATVYYNSSQGYGNTGRPKVKITYWNKWLKVVGGEFDANIAFNYYSFGYPETYKPITEGAFRVKYTE